MYYILLGLGWTIQQRQNCKHWKLWVSVTSICGQINSSIGCQQSINRKYFFSIFFKAYFGSIGCGDQNLNVRLAKLSNWYIQSTFAISLKCCLSLLFLNLKSIQYDCCRKVCFTLPLLKSKTTRVNTLSLFKRASHLPPLAKHHWNVAENICEAIQVFPKNKFLSWSVTEQLHHAQLDWKHGMNTIKLDCHEKRRWKVPKSKHCILDALQQWYI